MLKNTKRSFSSLNSNDSLPLVEAANATSTHQAATILSDNNFAVIPLHGKIPQISGWPDVGVVSRRTIDEWADSGLLQNVGIVTGTASGNLVVIDLDGEKAIDLFLGQFPQYKSTYSVATGSGTGRHLYLYVARLPEKGETFKGEIGNIELKVNGHQVVAPPSIHPDTKQPYRVENHAPILRVDNVDDVVEWLLGLQQEAKKVPSEKQRINPAVTQKLYEILLNRGFKESSSGWLQGKCPSAQKHNNDDSSASFSFNLEKGFGRCFGCQLDIELMEMCELMGVDVQALGGLYKQDASAVFTATNGKVTTTQIGDKLIAEWDGNLAYFGKAWHHYDNGVWAVEDNIDRLIWDAMKQAQSYGYQASAYNRNSILDYIRSQLYVSDDSVGKDDDYLNLKNGLYNLQTHQLEDHKRELYLVSQLPYDYDPEAKCEQWERFVRSVLVTPEHTPDEELMALLQEAMGYTLTTSNIFQKSFWLCGVPASGKSTLIKVLENLLGDAHMAIDLGGLKDNPYQLADLANKRCVTCSESFANGTLAESIFKQLVGGDTYAARQIYQKTINLSPTCKVWWAMNELPRNRDRSGAVERRLTIIPFHRQFGKQEQDIRLLDKLLVELPGILNWALMGLVKLNSQGEFTEASQSERLINDYRNESDIEGQFVRDCCEKDTAASVRASELYSAYKMWCEQNGHRARSNTKTAADWQRLGFEKDRNAKGVFYSGLKLKNTGTGTP